MSHGLIWTVSRQTHRGVLHWLLTCFRGLVCHYVVWHSKLGKKTFKKPNSHLQEFCLLCPRLWRPDLPHRSLNTGTCTFLNVKSEFAYLWHRWNEQKAPGWVIVRPRKSTRPGIHLSGAKPLSFRAHLKYLYYIYKGKVIICSSKNTVHAAWDNLPAQLFKKYSFFFLFF